MKKQVEVKGYQVSLNYKKERANLYTQYIGDTCPICRGTLIEFDEVSSETNDEKRLWAWAEEAGIEDQDSPQLVKYCSICKIWDSLGSCC